MSSNQPQTLLSAYISRVWWVAVVQGILAIALGLAVLFWPGVSTAVLVTLFGFFAIAYGLIDIVAAIADRHQTGWGWRLAAGVLGILLGVVVLFWPLATALVLVVFIGAWAIVMGISAIVTGIQLHRRVDSGWGWSVVWGVLSVVFGFLIMFAPVEGLVTIVWLLGFYTILAGVTAIVAGIGARSFGKKLDRAVTTGQPVDL